MLNIGVELKIPMSIDNEQLYSLQRQRMNSFISAAVLWTRKTVTDGTKEGRDTKGSK